MLSIYKITYDKYLIISGLLIINVLLSALTIVYRDYWYVFIIILCLASLINSINVVLIIFNYLRKKIVKNDNNNNNMNNSFKCKYIYVLPCYNEIEKELKNTIESIYSQSKVEQHEKILTIICDGKIDRKIDRKQEAIDNAPAKRTDEILIDVIFKDYITETHILKNAYKIWNNEWNDIDIYTGEYRDMKFIIIIKPVNIGKRDSLTLIRRMCYYYNYSINITNNDAVFIDYINWFSPELIIIIESLFNCNSINFQANDSNDSNSIRDMSNNYIETETETDTIVNSSEIQPVYLIDNGIGFEKSSVQNNNTKNKGARDSFLEKSRAKNKGFKGAEVPLAEALVTEALVTYIIGTDADTILDNDCSRALIEKITNEDSNTVAVVGIVDIVKSWNPLVIYQYFEYLYSQCLKRYAQSNITHKVSCLSGCVQLIKVCKETCGNKILNKFNYLPKETENILHHIRSYASEDRNHVCLMFSMYSYVKTVQSLEAISYTNVPNTFMKFIRQRKRWSAGASVNDILLVVNGKHNKWERIQAFVNVLMFCLAIFVYIATIIFLIAIINSPTYLMLYLSIIMLLPILYSLYIPIGIYNDGMNNKNYYFNMIYYWIGFILFYTLGPCISLIVNIYTFYNLDNLNWNGRPKYRSNSNNSNNSNISNNIRIDTGYADADTEADINTSKKGFDYTKKIKFRKGFLICSVKYLKEDENESIEDGVVEDGVVKDDVSKDDSIYDDIPIINIPLTPISPQNRPISSHMLNLSEIENYKHNNNKDNNRQKNRNTNIHINTQINRQHFSLILDELKSKTLIKLLKPTLPSSSKLESPTLEQPDIDVNQMWDSRSI